jgi:hypothetical protein
MIDNGVEFVVCEGRNDHKVHLLLACLVLQKEYMQQYPHSWILSVLMVITHFVAARMMSDMKTAQLAVARDKFECCHQVLMFGFGQMKFLVLAESHDIPMLGWWCVGMTR